jgi:uncharacterized membrane protein YkoI
VVAGQRFRRGSNMKLNRKMLVAGTVVVVVVGAAGASAVIARQNGDDAEASITGDALARASEAALSHVGEGRVTDTEVGDEDSYYEVEVTLNDGSQVDVQLDRSFNVVGDELDGAEDEGSDDADE